MGLPAADPGGMAAEWVSARKAMASFKHRSRMKGLFWYTAFFLTYFVSYQVELDWVFAGTTITLYRAGRKKQRGVPARLDPWCSRSTGRSAHTGLRCWWTFKEASTIAHLDYFLAEQLSDAAVGVEAICPGCMLGITTERISLESLSLADFACADFDSRSDSNEYPDRDCSVADARWAASPSASYAPCCDNKSLVKASFIMMARFSSTGQASARLDDLLQDDQTLTSFIEHRVRHSGDLAQVVVSRSQRMAGIHLNAAQLPEEWLPGRIAPSTEIWSRRYDIPSQVTAAHVVEALLDCISCAHTIAECWATYVDREDLMSWFRAPSTWVIFLSLAFPISVMITDPLLSATHWTQLISASQVVMLARLFIEARAIPACRVLIKAISLAAPKIASLMLVLLPIMLLLSGIQGQLSGVFLSQNYGGTFFDVLAQFSNGASLNPEGEVYNQAGNRIMFLVILFVLFLTMSQIFITLLIDSFEAARENQEEQQLVLAVPEGYHAVPLPKGPPMRRATLAAVGWVTSYHPEYGAHELQVLRGLSVAVKEAEEADPSLKGGPLLLSREQVAKGLARARAGPAAERALLANFGVASDRPQEAEPPARDDRAELRAAVFRQAFAAGAPLAYSELRGLSEEALKRLQASLAAAAERGALQPKEPADACAPVECD